MLSIVMPAYNESEIIEASVREWGAIVERIGNAELIVVDDRSTDSTAAIVVSLQPEMPCLRLVQPEHNGGHGRAVRLGLESTSAEWVFQTDSDRQHLPAEFWRLWELRGDADFVFGRRRRRADGLFRVFIARALRLVNRVLWGIWIQDANCPFKLMRRSALVQVLGHIPADAFIPMVMVSILARRLGYRTLDVEVEHRPRAGGQQSLAGLTRWIRTGWRCIHQLLQLRIHLRRAAT